MTEQAETPEIDPEDATETPVQDAEDSQEVEAPENGSEDDPQPGRSEAAKWRVRFREAEAANAALSARVEALQRAQVARLVAGPGKLYDGDDLAASVDLATVLDDAGDLDEEKVAAALDDLLARKPHLQRPVFDGDAGQGPRGESGGSISWQDVLAR